MLYLRLLRLIFNYRQKHSFSLCTRRVHAVCLLLLPFFLCTPLFLLFKFFFVLFLFFRCFCCCCFVLPLFFSSSVCVCVCVYYLSSCDAQCFVNDTNTHSMRYNMSLAPNRFRICEFLCVPCECISCWNSQSLVASLFRQCRLSHLFHHFHAFGHIILVSVSHSMHTCVFFWVEDSWLPVGRYLLADGLEVPTPFE